MRARAFKYFCFIATILVPVSASAQGLGLNFVDPTIYSSIPLAAPPVSGPLPVSVDLSKYFPRPGNQGNQASCVGWALGYALKSYQENREFRDQGVESDHMFSPSFIYNQINTSWNCQGGTYITDALALLDVQGILSLSDFPYFEHSCSKRPTSADLQTASEWRIANWRRVNVQSTTEVKSQIAAGHPVVVGLVVYQNFITHGSGVYRIIAGQERGGHAMVVVGYDDNRNAFKLINSWGGKWGSSGFGWIDYNTFRQITREGYVVADIVNRRQPEVTSNQVSAARLRTALRGSIAPVRIGTTSKGYPTYPYSVWLDLPKELRDQIAEVEYIFDYPGFENPKRPEPNSSLLLVSYIGYGCLDAVELRVTLVSGEEINLTFDHCKLLD